MPVYLERRTEAVDRPSLGATSAPPSPSAAVGLQHLGKLVAHLVRRELNASHRGTLFGWMWPLLRQLVQLAVLVFVFSTVLALGVEDYPVFVFSGLIAWSWFASGTGNAARSLLSNRHLVMQPRFPAIVLPIVAIAVPLIDVLIALPVLGTMLLVHGQLGFTVLALPPLLLVQALLMAGIAWIVATTSVYLRDVPNLVGLVLMLGFYVTPVYFALGKVPAEYASLLQLNPMAVMLDSYRAVLLGHPFPNGALFVALVALSVLTAVAGYLCFRVLEPRLVDEL